MDGLPPMIETPLHMGNGDFLTLQNGTYTDRYGVPWVQKELPIPFIRNRFSNPVGRIIGPQGVTAKTLRRETGCMIVVHEPPAGKPGRHIATKVSIRIRADALNRDQKLADAERRVLRIINEDDPRNQAMSDHQLFNSADDIGPEFNWDPSSFGEEPEPPKVAPSRIIPRQPVPAFNVAPHFGPVGHQPVPRTIFGQTAHVIPRPPVLMNHLATLPNSQGINGNWRQQQPLHQQPFTGNWRASGNQRPLLVPCRLQYVIDMGFPY